MAENVFSNASLTGTTTVSGSVNFSGAQISGLYKRHVGLGLVDNTSDMDKPISTAVQTALDNILGNANSGGVGANSGGVADEAISENKIVDGAVTSAKIANNAVTGGKIADGAVTSAKIADWDPAKVNTGIQTAKIANEAVTSTKIANNAVTADKIANWDPTKVNTGIQTAKIADGAVTFSKLASGAIISFDNNPSPTIYDVAGKMVITEAGGMYVLRICVVSGIGTNPGIWRQVLLN
jgi:hypothetical protein